MNLPKQGDSTTIISLYENNFGKVKFLAFHFTILNHKYNKQVWILLLQNYDNNFGNNLNRVQKDKQTRRK